MVRLLGALLLIVCLGGCSAAGAPQAAPQLPPAGFDLRIPNTSPHASHVTVVMMENRDYSLVIGSAQAPYINNTLVPMAALMTDSHAVTHPSQPNYLAIFSGSTQGISDDSCPHTFSTANLGSELLGAGLTFDGYSESMPSNGYTGCTSGQYARKHNPWVNFTNVSSSYNLVFTKFPKKPPSADFIVPNLCNDMHDCSTQTGDNYLKSILPKIIKWDNKHDGLLILTWDEADPDNSGSNQIATLLIGPMIVAGQYNQNINHYSVLATIESIFGLACTANACSASQLTGMWQ